MKKILMLFLLSSFLLSACGKEKKEEAFEAVPSETVQTEAHVKTEEINKEKEPIKENYSVTDKIIVIDPGHGTGGTKEKEAIAPGSSIKKAAYVSGAAGKNQTEEELNLKVALKLKTELEEKGALIYLTREGHEATLSNVGRAEFANDLNADICVRIHADGSENSKVCGASVLIPTSEYIKDTDLLQKSKLAGEIVLDEYVKATGAKNRGISKRGDMTGFNWSKVPVILVELGFMSNPEEDALMETEEYQNKMALGILNGLERYFKYL